MEKVIKMRCREVQKKLDAYLDRELHDNSEHDLVKHLSVCVKCRRMYHSLSFSRLYLGKIRSSPGREFIPDTRRIFSQAHSAPRTGVSPYGPALVAISVLLVAGFFYFTFLNKPLSVSKDGVASLPEARRVYLDKADPVMVKVTPDCWLNISGKAALYKDAESLKVELGRSQLHLISVSNAPFKKVIFAGGLEITAMFTEFYVGVDSSATDIQVLSGQLVVKDTAGKGLAVYGLSSGEGLRKGMAESGEIETYRLTAGQKNKLAQEAKRIKKIGRWFGANPRQSHFESGDVRIEYWKGE